MKQWWNSVLTNASDKSVILLWKGLCHPYSNYASSPGLPPMPCLPFQVQPVTLLHPLVSIDHVFYSILINIFYWKHFLLVCINKKLIIWHICWCVFFWQKAFPMLLWKLLSSCQEGWPNRWGRHRERSLEEVTWAYVSCIKFVWYYFSFCMIILLTFPMLYYLHFKHFEIFPNAVSRLLTGWLHIKINSDKTTRKLYQYTGRTKYCKGTNDTNKVSAIIFPSCPFT